jgi:hypothetical protein
VVYYRRAENDSMQGIFENKYFLFTVGSVCRVKRFTTGSRNSFKGVGKSEMMPDRCGKWLRQQSKDVYAADFDALTNVSVLVVDMSRNKKFFLV